MSTPKPNPKKSKAGRPTVMTPQIQKGILDIVRKGNFRSVACRAMRVGRSTLGDFLRKQTPDSQQFSADLLAAEAEAEIHMVGVMTKLAEQGDMQAVKFFLISKNPDEWGDQKRELRELKRSLNELSKMVDEITGTRDDK